MRPQYFPPVAQMWNWLPGHKLSGLSLVSRIFPSHFPWKSPGTRLATLENLQLCEKCWDVITELTTADLRFCQTLFYIFIRTSYHKIWYPYPYFSLFFHENLQLYSSFELAVRPLHRKTTIWPAFTVSLPPPAFISLHAQPKPPSYAG